MHKVEVTHVTSVLALWVLSREKKKQNPQLYFPRDPLRRAGCRGGGGTLCTSLKVIFPALAFIKHIPWHFCSDSNDSPDLCSQVRISKNVQCYIPSLQRKSDLHVYITRRCKIFREDCLSMLFHPRTASHFKAALCF